LTTLASYKRREIDADFRGAKFCNNLG
jgi:hypothetical protein